MSRRFLALLTNVKLLAVVLLGFSSGLPFLLVGGTLKAWMTRSGIDLGVVGLFTFVKMPYTWKFLWSPLLDRYQIPRLGRRRGWMLISQLGVTVSLLAITHFDPHSDLLAVAVCALLVSFFSASQDIVIDAYRREILPLEQLGVGSSLAVFGYRVGTMVASGGAFILADQMSWPWVYRVMAALMAIGMVTAFFTPEPEMIDPPPASLRASVVEPFREFFRRDGALILLLFVFFYKAGEGMANEMYNQLYIALGFTNTEIGAVTKVFAVWMMIAGGVVGGIAMVWLGLYRSLWTFGILQSLALLLFCKLAQVGHSVTMLAVTIGSEYFTSGMATAAFVAFIASQSNRRFTAVQYSLLTALGVGLPSQLLGGLSGFLAKALGWQGYFLACAALTLPGLLILFKIKPMIERAPEST